MSDDNDAAFEMISALAGDKRWPGPMEVRVESGYERCIHIWFISEAFAEMSERRRSDLAWDILESGVDDQTLGRVTLMFTFTPEEFADYYPEVASPLPE